MSSGLIEVPLGLELVFPGGRVRHDYSQLPAPRVVRALARAHLSLTNSGGGIKTPGTSWLYARAIRRIAPFFERELAIDALGALDADAYRRMIADLGGGHLESCARALLLRLVEQIRTWCTRACGRCWSPRICLSNRNRCRSRR